MFVPCKTLQRMRPEYEYTVKHTTVNPVTGVSLFIKKIVHHLANERLLSLFITHYADKGDISSSCKGCRGTEFSARRRLLAGTATLQFTSTLKLLIKLMLWALG